MKRRIFIRLAAATTASLYLPNLGCKSKQNALTDLLAQPSALQHICDKEAIRAIGEAYQKLVPNENDRDTLIKLVLASSLPDRAINQSADSTFVRSVLDQRVTQDFQENKTMVVDGWVLSVTEARQCALFSLTQN